MKDAPNIDPSLLTVHTKSDRNLPIAGAAGFNPRGRSVRMMPELGMGYGGAAQPGGVNFGNGDKAPVDLGGIRWQEPHAHKGIMTLDEIATAECHVGLGATPPPTKPRAHSHYFKDVSQLTTVDVYRVLTLFSVIDPCLQHAIKKLLVAGGRGGGKDVSRDIQEAIDTLKRWQNMRAEEVAS
jgi:hypothetical protein